MNDFSTLYSQMCKLYEELEYKALPKTDSAISTFKQALKDNFGTSQKMLDQTETEWMKEIYKDNKLIGYVGFSEYEGTPEDDYDYALGIGNFIILDKGKGLGTEVIKDIVEKYKKDYDLIYCFVDQNNKGAIRLYKRLGRVYDEEEPNEKGEYYVVFYDKHDEMLNEYLSSSYLTEGTRYDEKAAEIIAKSGLFDLDTSKKIIDGLFREDIHAFVHSPSWLEKYLKGIARMLVQESNGNRDIAKRFLEECPQVFDEYLTWIKEQRPKLESDKAKLNFDNEFIDKLTYSDVKNKLEQLARERDEKSRRELAGMEFKESEYTLVPINSFKEFNSLYGGRWTGDGSSDKYAGGGGTAWCHANNQTTYNRWVDSKNKFFVLQKNNWKDIPFNSKTNKELSGKDVYGNSLIAILVNKYGWLKNATLRCNHVGVEQNADNQYKTYAELSKLAGFNIEDEVKKYLPEVEEEDSVNPFVVKDGVLYWDSEIADDLNIQRRDIESYIIPDSVTSISDYAFIGCRNLTFMTIPDSVMSIGKYAFKYCSGLTSVTIGNGVTSIGDRAFYGCSGLQSVTIGNSVTSIGDFAFWDCSSLMSIKIPNSVMSIGNGMFSGCSGLTSVILSNSVTSIGEGMFSSCDSLISVTIPDSVMNINGYAFTDCSSLTSVTIPDSVTSIGSYAFDSCSGLTEITIPDSVMSISRGAFSYCDSLKTINFKGTIAQWKAIKKSRLWNSKTGNYVVQCTDGRLTKKGANESLSISKKYILKEF